MEKVVSLTFVISLIFCLSYAEETPNMKEPTMQTIAETLSPDQEATQALKKLEEEKEETSPENLDACPTKAVDDELEDDFDDEDDEEDWDEEEDGDWDEDYDDEDEE